MSNEFKTKIKDDIKININPSKFEKNILKIKGKNNKNEIFIANIVILFNIKSDKISVKKINISKLEIINLSEELSYDKYKNIYNTYSLSSNSSSCKDENIKDIYKQLIIFTKNIKLLIENNKINGLFLTIKNTNIKKMKLRGNFN